ncbi:hypothetical protein HYT57_04745 [Candidatus Woesearchaeota archaeon]|nr:hypothetical protein [Candidatus Woesearchaeota archaeon]
MEENDKVKKEIKDLVLVRLEAMPKTIKIAFGSDGELGKEELMKNVREESSLGKLIVKMQLEYLKSLKTGLQNE